MCTPTDEVLNLNCNKLVGEHRLTERFVFERTFKDHLVQPTSHGQGGTSFIRSGGSDPEGEMDDGKMQGLWMGL